MNIAKRIFDFTFALTGLFLGLPLWFLFGLGIWLEDGRPIFYTQERIGKAGTIFKGVKFRSMIRHAEVEIGPVQAGENDYRVTKIGRLLRKTAMDELPQLLNILKGQMSFVGPRALRPVEIDSEDSQSRSVWEFEGFKERSSINPGLTGVAQIMAPRDIPRREKFKYDIWYIKNQNFWLDVKIIAISFLVTFKGAWEIRQDRFKALAKNLRRKIEKEIF